MASVRVFVVDHYMSPPIKDLDAMYSEFRGTEVRQVPVIRIFGSSAHGQKTCLHVHGVFPYTYVPYDGSEPADTLIYKIAIHLDKAVNISLGQASSSVQHVYKVVPVSGIPMYGYHRREHQFLKIYFYNPLILKKACSLLQNGSVLEKVFQPHEAHLNHSLQFMIDYNLYGMSFINLSEVKYRVDSDSEIAITTELVLNGVPKQSNCFVEMDALASHILNRQDVVNGQLTANPGIAAIWEDERRRRHQHDLDSQLGQTDSQRAAEPTSSHLFYHSALMDRLASSVKDCEFDSSYVYPSETLDSDDILNASSVISEIDTSNIVDTTVTDPQDLEFMQILCELNEINERSKTVEDDSVLSQNPVTSMNESVEKSDDENDLTLSTNDCLNLHERVITDSPDNGNVWEDSFWDKGLHVSQLDGADDSPESKKLSGTESESIECDISVKDVEFRQKRNNRRGSDELQSPLKRLKSKSPRLKYSPLHLTIQSPVCQANMELSENKKDVVADLYYPRRSKRLKELSSVHPGDFVSVNSGTKMQQNDTKVQPVRTRSSKPKKNSRRTKSTFREREEKFLEQLDVSYSEKSQRSDADETNSNLATIELTEAEKYDKYSNFVPEPGPSKVIETDSKSNSVICSVSFEAKFDETRCHSIEANRSSMNVTNLDVSKFCLTQQSRQFKHEYSDSRNLSTIWMPKYLPPNRQDVETTLEVYQIPKVKEQEPFYSDYSHVTGKTEIGNNVLNIPSKSVFHLPEFKTSLTSESIVLHRKAIVRQIGLSQEIADVDVFVAQFIKTRTVILTPAFLPPSVNDVEKWVIEKAVTNTAKETINTEEDVIASPKLPSQNSISDSPRSPRESSTLLLQIPQPFTDTPKSDAEDSAPFNHLKSRQSMRRKSLQATFNKSLKLKSSQRLSNSYGITGVTLDNTHGFQMSFENLQHAKTVPDYQYLTLLALELHIQTRGDLKPDPMLDGIFAAFYAVSNDVPNDFTLARTKTGMIVVGDRTLAERDCIVDYVATEKELINGFVEIVKKSDPDICLGYEIEMLSWGYLIERAYVLEINLLPLISRIPSANTKKLDNQSQDWKLTGRVVLDIWRLLRHEIALQNYTFENVAYHILHRRFPLHSFKDLSYWWDHKIVSYRCLTANYYLSRIEATLKLLEQLDLISRTSELAKLFGIQFFEVLSRGSQFRVESMMLRLAKPLNYIPVSPSIQQRAKMNAPECLPLILEPESRLYVDPVIVLDFQSLYPSMIIAYNYCFSTCLGKVDRLGQNNPFEFGATHLKVPTNLLHKLKSSLSYSPCGVAFVKPAVREGILPRMLREILNTRLMVKKCMKDYRDDKILQRILHSRQLGLKLIANVTYGYTAANFSGRMPCVEVADSVVSKGRETLERGIKLVEATEKWRARVVYGDTDSMFVLVPGRSRQEAFKIGAEIARAITDDNPSPVKLKLEKVYQPCILQTKKRYVGYMYETVEQEIPKYEAKGIETVRRDGCPAVVKMLEKSLCLLFETKNVSLVRQYVCRQFSKLISGQTNLQDLIFSKEYRGMAGYRPGACVPALELAKKWMQTDKRSEPRRGQRVPYVVINGPPGFPLIRLVRSPHELLTDPSLRPNVVYYITRVIIPSLNRCFTLIGADLHAWFNEIPRKHLQSLPNICLTDSRKTTISQYFTVHNCAACGNQSQNDLCHRCALKPHVAVVLLQEKLRKWETAHAEILSVCRSCCNRPDKMECISLDCPVLFKLSCAKRDLMQAEFVRQIVQSLD